MKRPAFLLGLYSIGGQVLLLRELISSLNGDELFIGTALVGWLLTVAIGAGLGGRKRLSFSPRTLFIAGSLILPISLVAIRILSVLLTAIPGEIIPFSTAALISILMMAPVGIISGLLFAFVAKQGYRPSESIIQTYLFEGFGAFVGGILITLLVGTFFSTFSMAILLVITVLAILLSPSDWRKWWPTAILILIAAVIVKFAVPPVDANIDQWKYRLYKVETSFDTPYGHQVILSRDSAITLMTDNTVEATFPDIMTAENILLPPLLYSGDSARILLIGRSEFGLAQLADSIKGLNMTAIDPRAKLTAEINRLNLGGSSAVRIDDEPFRFAGRASLVNRYDIIILNCGEPDNYLGGRFLTERFFNVCRRVLKEKGMIFIPTHYDTDRYLSVEKKAILSDLHNTLNRSFRFVHEWPGEMTLFFASNDSLFELPTDSLVTRARQFGYSPQYINDNYLPDRLQPEKEGRLAEAISASGEFNTVGRPVLIIRQALYRARAGSVDKWLLPFIYENHLWLLIFPVGFILMFFSAATGRRKRRRVGLCLYFMAGLISLSLELISFYLFQSSAGSLYSEMGALIGVFMLGLSLGTYMASKLDPERLEIPSIFLILFTTLLFLLTHDRVSIHALLYYYLFFLFTVALATAAVFVAATNRYYFGRSESNRGLGYAFEIVGSSIGALLPITILLPIIGLTWILVSLLAVIILTLAVSLISS
ncbi:membrane hypothetical protein [Candidatus Zixiibacteriota bacterium]|nr:membrane hypothetical protein [candidate division Zixibacteria bacterium]